MEDNIKIAYFSAEIGICERIKTYSGGLGILAGDTVKAMADLSVPVCAVTLLYRNGFFKQKIVDDYQNEIDDIWDYKKILEDTGKFVYVNLYNTKVKIQIYKYEYLGISGSKVPIYFLDTNLDENPDWVKDITSRLYLGNRLAQEIVLGIGGYRALKELGLNKTIEKYHMNEGHSAFLTLEIYKELGFKNGFNDEQVRKKCVFTTHTPIPAGHDKFDYNDVYNALSSEKDIIPWHIKQIAGNDLLNTTKLALYFSSFHNAVSRKHMETTKKMFPNYNIDYITNGVHLLTWTSKQFKELYDKYIPNWKNDYSELKKIHSIPNSEIFRTHKITKENLINFVNQNNIIGLKLDKEILTIGFARRFIGYKDAELIFENIDNLKRIGKKVQFIFSGKAHRRDGIGKDIMRRIIKHSRELKDFVKIAFIENYDIEIAKLLVSGCDLWLNTPIIPKEASGTSGMKASANGVPHFSRLDGWAIEGFERNGGGFVITEYQDFVNTLEYKIIPMFYSNNKTIWVENMKLAIANSASYFNAHRMVKEYLEKAYKIN